MAKLKGGVNYVRDPALAVSARRLFVEGPAYRLKSILWATLRMAGLKASVFGYRWEEYPAHLAAEDPIITDVRSG